MRKTEGRILRPRVVGPADLRPRAGKKGRGGSLAKGTVLGIAFLLAVALLGLTVPAALAFADEGGTVEIGIAVGERVEKPASGDTGTVELGVAVGHGKQEDGSYADEQGGMAELGVMVGYRTPPAGESTITFDAGKGAFADGAATRESVVPTGSLVAVPEAPKRVGWQFGGWHVAGAPDESWDSEGASAVPIGNAWNFSHRVTGDMTLHARWELRLDVTVPVSVGFAVNADTGEAMGPEPGAYSVKSRTVVPVQVDRFDLESRDAELDGFFELSDDAEGERPLAGANSAIVAAWEGALAGTKLSLKSEGADDPVELPFAGEHTALDDKDGIAYWAWIGGKPVPSDERDAWKLPASLRGIADPGVVWDGSNADRTLRIDFGLNVSDKLKVKVGQSAAVPITHLKLTVSAQG